MPSTQNLEKLLSNEHRARPAGLPSTHPTRSFWTDSASDVNPLAREGSTGPLSVDADVCIIGSGLTGVGVAYHLSEAMATGVAASPESAPLRVVILEARDFCAGATGRNGGHLTPAAFSRFHARTAAYGPEEARRSYALEAHTTASLVRLIHDHGWTDAIDLVQGGHVYMLCSDADVVEAQQDREAAVDAGWSLEGVVELSKEEVHATYGAHYPAVLIPGYNLWPLKLVTKLYQQAKTRTGSQFDLTLHTHTPVTAIERADANATRAYRLSTPRGTIACTRVVHATNGYASHLLPFLTGSRGIVPVRGQIIATRASVSTDEIKTNSWSAKSEYWFPRPVKTNNERPLVLLGGAREASGSTWEAYVDDDTVCHPDVSQALRAFLPTIFEGKFEPGREPEMEWTGITGYTAIGDPFVGPVDKLPAARAAQDDAARYAGQFIAAGYSGHGMPRTFGCAEVVAQMIVAELRGTVWTRPEWLPARYLTWEVREPVMITGR